MVNMQKPELAAKTELLTPIFHHLLEEQHLFSGVRSTSLCLLLHLWLYRTSEEDLPSTSNARIAIAKHKDSWKGLDLLKQSVDHPDREPCLAKPHAIVQSSFVGLLSCRAAPSARAPPSPYLETLCHLLGELDDLANWFVASEVISVLFRNGTLLEQTLLTHAYPGFLRSFVDQVACCGYATSSVPGQISPDPRSEKLLGPMIAFLAGALRQALTDFLWKQSDCSDPELDTDGPSLKPQTLLRLVELMVSLGAAEALAALSGSPFYPRANILCSAIAQLASGDTRISRALLDQMVPAIVLKMYEDCNATRGRAIERGIRLRQLCRTLRSDEKQLGFGAFPPPPAFVERRCVKYDYESNFVVVSDDVIAGKEDVVADLFKEIDKVSIEARVARVTEDIERTRCFSNKAKCSVCESDVGQRKRCAQCKRIAYCSVECQKKDWPSHKKVCNLRG